MPVVLSRSRVWQAARELAVILLLALVPTLVSGLMQLKWMPIPEPLGPGEVRPATARLWSAAVQWVDARSRAEYEGGHIAGAVRLDLPDWETQVAEFLQTWEPSRSVVVYAEGKDTAPANAVAERLRSELQLEGVWVLKGGWEAWQRK